MIKVTGVRFVDAGKIYDFEASALDLKVGDRVVVETQNGEDIATIAYINKKIEESQLSAPLKQILRKATASDLENEQKNKNRGKKYLGQVKQKTKDFGLPMSIVSVDYSFDGQKVVVNFTSEERVDFRELLKDLGAFFKKRVELRQIGIRDETKLVGGLGVCGQPCCCKRFLDDFGHVSVKMAKTQNLSLNPTKISGLCGRLMCCLAYENEFYQDAQKGLPKIGGMAKTPEGIGKLVSTNLLKEVATVKFVNGDETVLKQFALSELSPAVDCNNCSCPNKPQQKQEQPQKQDAKPEKLATQESSENKDNHKKSKHHKRFKKHKKGENQNGLQNKQ